jgi:hypothetical protein
MNRYLDEFTWRYNRRDANEGARVNAFLAAADGKCITDTVLVS